MSVMGESTVEIPVEQQDARTRPNGIVARLGVLITSHAIVDVYSAYVPPLLGVLEVRCRLTHSQTAWLIGIGSLTSGLCQPVSAWLSDRLDTRIFGAAGMAIAAICLSLIGLPASAATLFPLFIVGMIGSGIFHPTGASSMGQLADDLPGGRRAMGLSLFHVAGMAGGFVTSLAVPRVAAMPNGFSLLQYGMIPGLLLAIILHMAIRRIPHRHHAHHVRRVDAHESRKRWATIRLLFIANAVRFTVNTMLVYLFVRWANSVIASTSIGLNRESIAEDGSKIVGNLNAMLIVGMAIGGISASALVKRGREKWPMTFVPILLAPAVALFPIVGITGGYGLSVLSGMGFAAMIPVSIGLAQRLLPHRTSLASSLMMGGAWALAFIGPRGAEYCLSSLGWSLGQTFALAAVLLAISGLVCLFLNQEVLTRSAIRH